MVVSLTMISFLALDAWSFQKPFRIFHANTLSLRLHARIDRDRDFYEIEKKVRASAQADLDMKRIANALDENSVPRDDLFPERVPSSGPSVALAAAASSATLALVTFHSITVSGFVFVVVFLAASGDPNDEESILGPIMRVLGRATIKSVEASQPKMKALARAVVTGEEEIAALKRQMAELQKENDQLRQWQERRNKLDENISAFSHEELKQYARMNGIQVGGTKPQLFLRLIDAGVIKI